MYSFINLSYSSSWCSLGKTDHFWKQIMSVDKYLYIFASQMKAFVYFISAWWLVIAYDLVGDRCEDDITINKIFLLYFVKQKDSMLQWVCTVVGHRGIQSLHLYSSRSQRYPITSSNDHFAPSHFTDCIS